MRATTARTLAMTLLLLSTASGTGAAGQERPTRWQRREEATAVEKTIFHSPEVFNLPTAVTLRQGELQFEISHRFQPPVSEGGEALFGLDGPVLMRLGLGYAATDHLLVTLARSNHLDNLDLQAKYRVLSVSDGPLPFQLALQGGAAWSTQIPDRDNGDNRNFQYYGQAILNTLVADRLGIGVVPSFLHNSVIDSEEVESSFSVGIYGQLYLTKVLSLAGEWNVSDPTAEFSYDAAAFGIELETGGHFFKILLTNSVFLNPSQYLVGAEHRFKADEWRLGFNVTRLLRF